MNTTESNKLIAEFMGWKQVTSHGSLVWDRPKIDSQKPLFGELVDKKENGKYHSSWDWLMPVVERIEADYQHSVSICWQHCIVSNAGYNKMEFGIELASSTKLDATYNAVVEFIKWYNQQKNNL